MIAIVALYCVLALRLIHVNLDDQFMLYRYAANLAHGDGLTFTGGVRVEGFTSFLYVVVLAALFKVLGLAAVVPSKIMWMTVTSKAVGLACGIGVLFYLETLVRRVLGLPRPWAIASLLSLVLCVNFTYSTTNGLETGMVTLLYTGLVTHTILWGARRQARKHLFAASAFAAASVLTRADGFLAVGGFVGSWVVLGVVLRRRELRGLLRDAVVLAAPAMLAYGTYSLFRHEYFGRWFPQSYYVKVYRGGWTSLLDVRDFWNFGPHKQYAWERIPGNLRWDLVPSVWGYLVALALLAGYLLLRGRRAESPASFYLAQPAAGEMSPLHALLLPVLPVAPLLVFQSTVGDWMPGHRMVIQCTSPAIALLAGAGLRFVRTSAPTGRPRLGAIATLVALFVGTGITSEQHQSQPYAAIYEVSRPAPIMATYSDQWFAVLRWRDLESCFTMYREFWADVARRLAPGDTVAVYESGYASLALGEETRIIDLSGLNDQRMSEYQDGEVYGVQGRTYLACQETKDDPKGDYIVAAKPKFIILDTFAGYWCESGFPVRLYGGRYRYASFSHNDLGFFSVYVPEDTSLEFHASFPNWRCSPACLTW